MGSNLVVGEVGGKEAVVRGRHLVPEAHDDEDINYNNKKKK